MSSLNEDKDLVPAAINKITTDGAIESPIEGHPKPRCSTDFSPAALQRALQAINGTLFTGDDATHNFTPLPCSNARIHCLPCILHGVGQNGYTISSYQQNHGPKCSKHINDFYHFYCNHLVNNNIEAPLSGTIPKEFEALMHSPCDSKVDVDDEMSISSMIATNSISGQFSDGFYSKLSTNFNKLIKDAVKAELESKPSAFASLPTVKDSQVDDSATVAKEVIPPAKVVYSPKNTRSNTTATALPSCF